MKWSLALAALLIPLGGCISASHTETSNDCLVNNVKVACSTVGELGVAAPKVDARQTLDALKQFSAAFPYRQSGSPTHLAARDDLAARFKAAGLDVVREGFPSGKQGLPVVGGHALEYGGENVIGVKWGSDRTRFIVVGAHYDVTEGAVYGTYDDGSGTAMVFKLAEAFAKVPTNRTILFVQFDQEELGLVGSRYLLNQTETGKFPLPGAVEGMIDLDMVGITWPHPAKLVVWQNSPSLKARIQVLANGTGMPADHLLFRKTLGGSSDGQTFLDANVPTAYLWSDWDEYILPDGSVLPRTGAPGVGGYAGAYPWWHKADTYDTMVLSAGDEKTLQAGFQTTLDIVSPLLLDMTRPAFPLETDA
ncbi:MAG TPA: M28 family peptidase [Candidatus Thermoplasmatota archaeon]|nr:M28 family peptidase [Candidatus Thermoplasmatota archaeon]